MASNASHIATCGHHGDIDRLLCMCGARCKNGSRCLNSCWSRIYSDFLPVCGMHSKQARQHRYAYCTALEECGQRCSRVCPRKEDMQHTCSKHRDAQLPCHFNVLPVELRFMIMDLLIPPGVIQANRSDGLKYGMIAALARVNRETNSHINAFVYQNASRSLQILLESTYIYVAGKSIRISVGAPQKFDSFTLSNMIPGRLGKFRRYDIVINKPSTEAASMFFALSAISGLRNKKTTGCHPTCAINLRFMVHVPLCGDMQSFNQSLDERFAGIRAIIRIAQIYHVNLRWSISLAVSDHLAHPPLQSTLTLTPGGVTVLIGRLDVRARGSILQQIQALNMLAWTVTSPSPLFAKWQTFVKIAMVVRDLWAVRYLQPSPVADHTALIQNASIALGHTSSARLNLLAQVIGDEWKAFISQHESRSLALTDLELAPHDERSADERIHDILNIVPKTRTIGAIVKDYLHLASEARTAWEDVVHRSYLIVKATPWQLALTQYHFNPSGQVVQGCVFMKTRHEIYRDRMHVLRRCAIAAAQVMRGQARVTSFFKPSVSIAKACRTPKISRQFEDETEWEQTEITDWMPRLFAKGTITRQEIA